ncbi:hypothetical protein [Streptomyces spectabilis]|uniref:Large membrane protein n=1 Tax=Streptomyces spectabilis TaxID=68270 RepID=A0A516R620_STRST|nr:hypothetical protein [Streptomyces spectabilis]QDQ11116.1 hypothetical protein FH965_11390 [Streptomyces spectabilis]
MSTEQAQDGRRRRPSLVVTSVAAAVLLAGGGGAYLAVASAGEDGTPAGGGGTPPPLALDGYADGSGGHSDSGTERTDRADGTNGGGGTPTEGIAPGEPAPSGVLYRASGELPEGPDEAAVYEPRGEVTKDQAVRLAKALGLSGTPTAQGDSWRLGPANDGSGSSLQVARKAPGTWSFTRSEPGGGDNCLKGKPCPPRTSPELDGGAPVGERAAKAAAAPVLKALGQDGAKLDARQLMGSVRVVNADPEVDGLPTYGWSTGVQVGPDGEVVGGSGQLSKPHKGATYPVVSADEALALLNATGKGGGVSIGGCATPVPHKGDEPSRRDEVRCTPTVPPKQDPIAVEGATFGLAAHFVAGRQTLVPSWLFEVRPQGARDAYTVSHPAVEPAYLKAPGAPGDAEPKPKPDKGDTYTSDVKVDGYSTSGRTLTVHFTGGVCSTYEASARESGGRVSVKVAATEERGKVCIALAKFYTLPVTLEKPLGDRKVVTPGGTAVPRDKGEVKAEPAPRS